MICLCVLFAGWNGVVIIGRIGVYVECGGMMKMIVG